MLTLQKTLFDGQYIYAHIVVTAQKNLCLLFGIVLGSTAQVYGCGQSCHFFAFSRWIMIFQNLFGNSVCP